MRRHAEKVVEQYARLIGAISFYASDHQTRLCGLSRNERLDNIQLLLVETENDAATAHRKTSETMARREQERVSGAPGNTVHRKSDSTGIVSCCASLTAGASGSPPTKPPSRPTS